MLERRGSGRKTGRHREEIGKRKDRGGGERPRWWAQKEKTEKKENRVELVAVHTGDGEELQAE